MDVKRIVGMEVLAHIVPDFTKVLCPTRQSRHDKPLKKTLEVKREHLLNVIDSVSKEINKALLQGKMPPRKLHNWVEEAKDIEFQLNGIQSEHNTKSSSLKVEQLTNMQGKVIDHLKKSPFKHGLVYEGPLSAPVIEIRHSTKYRVQILPDRQKNGEESRKGARTTKKQRSEKSEIIDTSFIEDEKSEIINASCSDDSTSVLKDNVKSKSDTEVDLWNSSFSYPTFEHPPVAVVKEMKSEIEIKESGVQHLQRNEGKRIDAAGYKETEPCPSVQNEAEPEAIPFPVTESGSLPDPTSAMTTETEAEILPVKKMGFENYASEGKTEGLQSIHEVEEVEISPSEAERETHVASDFCEGTLSKRTTHEAEIKRLVLSYDRLKDCDIKRCFLHCALMIEKDHEIKVDDLIDKFIEEDLIHGTSSKARKKGQDIIKSLIDSLLLVSNDGGLSISMRGVVKDLGLWIMTSKEEPYQGSITKDVILSAAGAGLTEPPPKELWEGKKMIFLMNNDFSRLHEEPDCHDLLTLLLQNNTILRSITDTFFSRMAVLRVLNLSKTGIRSLPPSLCGLTKLHDLILRHCNCLDELPPEIGNVGALEVLDLKGTELYHLPDEVGKLGSLRHLQVSFYEAIDPREYANLPRYLVSRETISKLLKLQELHIVVHRGDQRWNMSADHIAFDVGSLNELTSLQLYFPNVFHSEPSSDKDVLNKFIEKSQPWINKSLSKFKFIVGQNIKRISSRVPDDIEFDFDQHDRCLRFVNSEDKRKAVLEVLGRATAFYLDHHRTIRSLSEFGITNMEELKFCILSECPNILAVIDCEENSESALQNLEHLSIHYLWNLKSISKRALPPGYFNGLKFLSVHSCPKLEFILEKSMLPCLSNLEELVVEDCASLRKIIEAEEKTENDDFVILPSLRDLSLLYLPQLVSIWNGIRLLSKNKPTIHHCPNLKNALG
ncbi:disease resistance protein At4g27190-like isoform X2 [Cornus florida]|uniref:disease resistance protein At4g27190-like isoform X2 n=1 Tax=Cornus florida TaxID=4283 RepID=UPI00289679EF|nr:disease resistance protein At4g27190-like isoform X2 [Cornus florida]